MENYHNDSAHSHRIVLDRCLRDQVNVQNIQSIAGAHVTVPAPELQIGSSFWIINGTASLVTAVRLNVSTVGGPTNVTKLYQIFVQVSSLSINPPSTTETICATGNGTITLPANGGSGTLSVPISPAIDPELIEIHDLSFIVTGTPTPTPTCKPAFTVTATPTVVTINRTSTSSAKVLKTITYFGNCPGATISMTAASSPLGLSVSVIPPVITVPPSPKR